MARFYCWDPSGGTSEDWAARFFCLSRCFDRQWPATQAFPTVDQFTEQQRGLLGVIQGRMCLGTVERDIGGDAGFGQHRLPQYQPTQRRSIKGGEWMEGVTFQAGALCGGHQEAVIKIGIVRHNDCPVAATILNALAHGFKIACNASCSLTAPRNGFTWVYAVKGQRFRLQVGTFKRLHVEVQGLVLLQPAVFIHF
jgi:hypothetical protein